MRTALNKFDIYNENFNTFFLEHLKRITPEQKELLPDDLLYKIFKNGAANSVSLSFKEKVYIMSVAFNKRIAVVIEDEEDGLKPSDFRAALTAQAGKMINGDLLEIESVQAAFVLSNRELSNSIMYLNQVYCTDIYRLIRMINPKDLTKKDKAYSQSREAVRGVTNFLQAYERHKKRLVMEFNLDMPKIYALMYLSTGEKSGRDFYEKAYIYAYSANRRALSNALTDLTNLGYVTRRGARIQLKYQLTSKGIDVLDRLLGKIISLYQQPL